MGFFFPFETNSQLAEAGQARVSMLHDPTMTPEFVTLGASTRNSYRDA
ncbi:hypothetical protein AWB68_06326 [Caballeronia choica]|jgi:hypothetical protein|uniref:Uncharacterized protein n=1 Tax=Caballeronia choica TaxID=326476 RepID=A0A158KLE1_9BURK|nr:hypothetical protein AWB68_06326 [Caballeronia choica]